MLDQATRSVILDLCSRGHGVRQIARTLRISRGAVRKVLSASCAQVPRIDRPEKAEPYRDQIVDLFSTCKGNLVRVHEELGEQGATLSYPALTGFCRRHGIGHPTPLPVGPVRLRARGRDAARHVAPPDADRRRRAADRRRRRSCSVTRGCSSSSAIRVFTGFTARSSSPTRCATSAGACGICMIDNTHVVVASGTGADMVPAPGDGGLRRALRLRVSRAREGRCQPLGARRTPVSLHRTQLPRRPRLHRPAPISINRRSPSCEKVNAASKRHLHASPRELFAVERAHLRPLPLFVPEVYRLHQRLVDVEGYVSVDAHRYSVPYALIGRRLEVRETKDRIEAYRGAAPGRLACPGRHQNTDAGRAAGTSTAARPRSVRQNALPEERELHRPRPRCPPMRRRSSKRSACRGTLPLRRLLALRRDYPREAFLEAATIALQYGLFDLDRLERLMLRLIAKDYFVLIDDAEDAA